MTPPDYDRQAARDSYVGATGPLEWPVPATEAARDASGRLVDHHATLERRLIAVGFVVYVAAVTTFLVLRGTFPSTDQLALALVPLALLMRRGKTFVTDWVPFILILIAYEQFKGIAHAIAPQVHVTEVIAVERFLFGTPIPTVRLQNWFYRPGEVMPWDVILTVFYLLHFVTPLAVGFWIWTRSRRVYWKYVLALLGLSYAAFVTYAVLPVMPPRLATFQGALPPVTDVFLTTMSKFILWDPFFTVYTMVDPNPYAALPSVHIAYPVLVALTVHRFVQSRWGRLAYVYPAGMTLAVVYLGEHYLVDAIAGALYAWVFFWLVWDLPPLIARIRERRGRGNAPAAAYETPGAGEAGRARERRYRAPAPPAPGLDGWRRTGPAAPVPERVNTAYDEPERPVTEP